MTLIEISALPEYNRVNRVNNKLTVLAIMVP